MKRQVVSDFMARTEITLSPEMSVHSAVQSLLKHHLFGAPVVDDGGRLVGMLTDRECFNAVVDEATDGLPERRVCDYMTRDVETLSPTNSLFDVIGRFRAGERRKFPVIDNEGRVVGQVSRRDALVALESVRDNSYLYGSWDQSTGEVEGVDSAMRIARQRH